MEDYPAPHGPTLLQGQTCWGTGLYQARFLDKSGSSLPLEACPAIATRHSPSLPHPPPPLCLTGARFPPLPYHLFPITTYFFSGNLCFHFPCFFFFSVFYTFLLICICSLFLLTHRNEALPFFHITKNFCVNKTLTFLIKYFPP